MVAQQGPVMLDQATFRVASFGRDCLGNVSGFRVLRSGWTYTGNPGRNDGMNYVEQVHGTFTHNLYTPGSLDAAYDAAEALAAKLNA